MKIRQSPWKWALLVLGAIWLGATIVDRTWITIDRAVPGWDQADYMTGALNYWRILQTPHWFSTSWWIDFWQLSTKIPPLMYVVTAPFLSLFGKGPDQSTLVYLLFSAILLGTVYGLGSRLFSHSTGLWAAGLSALMPGMVALRLEYLLDYPLTVMVTLSFACLTLWWRHRSPTIAKPVAESTEAPDPEPASKLALTDGLGNHLALWRSRLQRAWSDGTLATNAQPWLLAISAGLVLGLTLLVKPSAPLFLLVPVAWIGGSTIWQRSWQKLGQWFLMLATAVLVAYPWYRTNWLLVLTSGTRATVGSAIDEGEPSLLNLRAWTYYLQALPGLVSPVLLVMPLLGLIFFWRRSRVSSCWQDASDYAPKSADYRQQAFQTSQQALVWLLVFLVGSYFLSSLNPNKDDRYIVPMLPILGIVLAYGTTLLPRRWRLVHWGAIGLTGVILLASLFPIGGYRPLWRFPVPDPYLNTPYPNPEVVTEVAQADPYLQSTIGVLPSTGEVNQHNISYFGALQNFRVYGRQVGSRQRYIEQDVRSLPWFLSKTGNQGSIRNRDTQAAIVRRVEQGTEFALHKTWKLPDRTDLKLYRRKVPFVEVSPQSQPLSTPLSLVRVTVPARVPPGKPVPVTYTWSGNREALQSGIVLLTWYRQGDSPTKTTQRWFHDHALGMGQLALAADGKTQPSHFQVIERTAMQIPTNLPNGRYVLQATYLNRQTQEKVSIAVPSVPLQIDSAAAPVPAPELDLPTQLRSLAETLPQGMKAVNRVFEQVGRISQYDPRQDYVNDTRQAMEARLQQEPENPNFAYVVALCNVLKRRVQPAIASMQRVVQLDANNASAYAYLAFVNLYDFRPGAAQSAIRQALKLNPKLPELYALNGVASLMRGNVVAAWQNVQTYQAQAKTKQGS